MDDERSGIPARWIIAVIFALISLVAYYGHSVWNPVTEEKQHISLSVDQEIALGLQAAPQMEAQYGGPDPNPGDQARVEAVGRRLVSRTAAGKTPYEFAFHALGDDRTINAFALPGGQVFITSGLLHRLSSEGQLAGVLGHEIGHVVARHGAEHLAKEQLSQGLAGAAVIATYDPDNPNSRQNAAIAMAIRQLVELRFDRKDELEADKLGVRFTSEAGYDPRAMLKVMEVLQEASHGGEPPEFFSTHPNPPHREALIKEEIQRRFPDGVPEGMTQ